MCVSVYATPINKSVFSRNGVGADPRNKVRFDLIAMGMSTDRAIPAMSADAYLALFGHG
jgi:hypothetical protein